MGRQGEAMNCNAFYCVLGAYHLIGMQGTKENKQKKRINAPFS